MRGSDLKTVFALVFGVMLVSGAGAVHAGVLDDLEIEASASQSFYSKYVWRGMLLDDDAVSQTDVSISGYGLTLGYWASTDIENNDALNSEEVDFYMDYTIEMEPVSMSLGYTYYEFPGASTNSNEAYMGFSVDTLLSPSVTVYYDFHDEDRGGGDGMYAVLSLSHSIELSEDITLDLSGSAAYNGGLWVNGKGGDALLSAGLTIALTDNLSMSPSISYSIPWGSVEDANKEEVFGGVSLGYSF